MDLDIGGDYSAATLRVYPPQIETFHVDQNSQEWYRLRAGVITASMFGLIMDRLSHGPDRGGFKKAARDYAFRLAVERLSGQTLREAVQTRDMARGHAMEPPARAEYELKNRCKVELGGFIRTKDARVGCSADGFANLRSGKRVGVEIKAFTAPDKMRPILIDGDVSDIRAQAQGGMYLTGLDQWDVNLYCDQLVSCGMQLTTIEEKRDDEYISRLRDSIERFDLLINDYVSKIRESRKNL